MSQKEHSDWVLDVCQDELNNPQFVFQSPFHL